MKRDYHIPFSAPLHPLDRPDQTYGCRRSGGPYVCPHYEVPNVCALVTEDHICKRPSNLWPRQYDKLIEDGRPSSNKGITFQFHAPLNPQDTEEQTYGCRRKDPATCPNYCAEGICAFVRDDQVCTEPSQKWKRHYQKERSRADG